MSGTEIGIEELARRLPELVLLDVRAAYEYDGSFGADCDPRQGHLPGALNLPVERLLALGDDELRALLELPEGGEIVAYCHSGTRSAAAVTVLARLGYRARNYAGSWHEWSRSDQPIELGPARDPG